MTSRSDRMRSAILTWAMAAATALLTWPGASASTIKTTSPAAPVKRTGKRRDPLRTAWIHHRGWSVPGAWKPAPRRSAATIAVATARAQIGKPYHFGSAGPGSFDCSGLVLFAYGAAGIGLPHTSRGQYGVTKHVDLRHLRPGDLVFSGGRYIHHVGIYIGGGRMIHAPQTGEHVKISPLHSNLIGASRPS